MIGEDEEEWGSFIPSSIVFLLSRKQQGTWCSHSSSCDPLIVDEKEEESSSRESLSLLLSFTDCHFELWVKTYTPRLTTLVSFQRRYKWSENNIPLEDLRRLFAKTSNIIELKRILGGKECEEWRNDYLIRTAYILPADWEWVLREVLPPTNPGEGVGFFISVHVVVVDETCLSFSRPSREQLTWQLSESDPEVSTSSSSSKRPSPFIPSVTSCSTL